MTINPQDQEVLSAAREKLLEDVASRLNGQKYIDAVLMLEDIIGISKKVGDLEKITEYHQKIAECIERFKSIQDDIEILKTDESLRAMIKDERSQAVSAAQQAAKNNRIEEAIESYARAIEFSLKLGDKKNIWKLSKSISVLKNKIPSQVETPLSLPVESHVADLQQKVQATPAFSSPAASTPQIFAPTEQPASQPTAPVPQITPPTPQPIPPVPQITPPTPQPIPPVPQIQMNQPAPTIPITSVEEAASVLGAEAPEEESGDSFFDDLVEDLKKQPQVETTPVFGKTLEKEAPFIPGLSEQSQPETTAETSIPFVQAPIEQQTPEAEPSVLQKELVIDEVEDKKIRRKMMLAEKTALKKLQEAEKKFTKVVKKDEKVKEKELKKQAEEERKIQEKLEKEKKKDKDKKKDKKKDKESKKDGKLKSKYQGTLPADVLSEIKARQNEDDS